MENNIVECPNCLGTGEMFDPDHDKIVDCTFCKGAKEVDSDKADMYDPVAFETGLDEEDYIIEEDD
jgi:hypothetical protein